MGSLPFTLRSVGLPALITAAVTLTSPEGTAFAAPGTFAASGADRPGGVLVTPASPTPGTDIALRITGCTERTATAASDAFVADALLAGVDGTLAGESRVRSSVRAGKYDVRVVCGSVRFKSAMTVAAAASPAVSTPPSAAVSASAAPATAPGTTSASAPASPVAPVRAGGGGTAGLVAVDAVTAVDEADGSSTAGPGTARSVTGFVLAAAAAVAVALRCSRRRREAD